MSTMSIVKGGMRRWKPLLASLCLASGLLVFLAGPARAADPLPSGITPVMVLSGSDYNMGYQYSQQAIALVGPWFYQKTPGVYMPFSDGQLAALKAYQFYLKNNIPEMISFLRGMADGATASGCPMTYAEALARQTGTRAFPGTEPPGSGDDTLPPSEMCSVWSAWGKTTRDGKLIAGDSFDAGYGFQFVTMGFPSTGNAYVVGNGLAMNNKGVWVGGSAGEGLRPTDRAGGYDISLSPSSLTVKQHFLRFCNSANEALDYFMTLKLGSAENRMFGDNNGGHSVLEYSAVFKSQRMPGDFGEGHFLTMRNNYFTDEGGLANLAGLPGEFYPHGGWAQNPPANYASPGAMCDVEMASVRTNQTMYNMLSQYRGKVDLDFAKMLWRFTGKMAKDPYSIVEFRDTNGRAWETPCNLMNAEVNICVPDNGNNGKVYVCSGPAGRVAEPYCADPTIEFYQIGGTNTFYELNLAATPGDAVRAAQLAATRYMTTAYRKLMYKDYGDVGFEGLDALFDRAKSEYSEGTNWVSRAALSTGNDVLLCQAQALTAFTRSQCHAQRVYEALVRPSVKPSDLGLKRYVAREYGF